MAQARLYLKNLLYAADENRLRDFFRDFVVVSVNIPRDRKTRRSKGFAFVTIEGDADEAIRTLDGEDLDGREVRVSKAEGDADSEDNTEEKVVIDRFLVPKPTRTLVDGKPRAHATLTAHAVKQRGRKKSKLDEPVKIFFTWGEDGRDWAWTDPQDLVIREIFLPGSGSFTVTAQVEGYPHDVHTQDVTIDEQSQNELIIEKAKADEATEKVIQEKERTRKLRLEVDELKEKAGKPTHEDTRNPEQIRTDKAHARKAESDADKAERENRKEADKPKKVPDAVEVQVSGYSGEFSLSISAIETKTKEKIPGVQVTIGDSVSGNRTETIPDSGVLDVSLSFSEAKRTVCVASPGCKSWSKLLLGPIKPEGLFGIH